MALISSQGGGLADLLVRGDDDALVQALKKRAGAHGHSQEAELRPIMSAALLSPPRVGFSPRIKGFSSLNSAGRGTDTLKRLALPK